MMNNTARVPLIDDAKKAKFHLEFMLWMLIAGRGEQAEEACQQALDALNRIIDADTVDV